METNAFQTRLMNLQSNMLNFAYMLTSNRDDAYDLLQDTTLKVLDNKDKYVENTNFKGWVFTIMRNIFINNYRRVVRSATVIDQTEDCYHLNLSQDSGLETPEGSYGANEITSAIAEFPEKYRVPFEMHVAGYKYNEPTRWDCPWALSRAVSSSPVRNFRNVSPTTDKIHYIIAYHKKYAINQYKLPREQAGLGLLPLFV